MAADGDAPTEFGPPGTRSGDSPLRPGETLAGYVIEAVAGRGGMGLVYRARDPELGRSVALKVIAAATADDPGFRRRFEREWRLTAALEHPNVVPVYRAGEADGRLFLAMRFIDGETLTARVDGRGRLAPDEAVELVAQIARALDAAHASGLVHRDVKPGNVLIAAGDGRVYLGDFGLTVRHDSETRITRAGEFVGTAAYAAPEQIRGERVDARTDVYALGAVLYQCLTGELPFPASSALSALSAHLTQPPPRPSAVCGDVPLALDRVVRRAMAKEASARHPSAGDLARAAQAAVSGQRRRGAERSVATGLAAPRPSRSRWPRRAAVAGVAVAAAAIALVLALEADPPSPRETAAPDANPAGRVDGEPITLQQPPDRLAILDGIVWALSRDVGRLARIDPATRRPEYFPAPVDLGGGLFPDIATGFGSVWTTQANRTNGGVDRIDPVTVQAIERIPLAGADAIAAGSGHVWVAAGGRLARIDPGVNRLAGTPVRLGRRLADIAVGAGAVWVADPGSDVVIRVDARSGTARERFPVGRDPGLVAVGGSNVWIANLGDRTLTRIDAERRAVVGAPVVLGKEIESIAADGAALWVASTDRTLTRLDVRDGGMVASRSRWAPRR